MMRVFLICSLFILTFVVPVRAQACLSNEVSEVDAPKLIEKAVFIGKLEVIERKDFQITVKFIQPYKEGQYKTGDVLSFENSEITDCDKNEVPVGKIYEDFIVEGGGADQYELSRKTQTLPESVWSGLRRKAEASSLLEEKIKGCIASNGEWIDYSVGYVKHIFDCYYPASDFEKQCNGKNNCEGYCLADFTEEERQRFWIKILETGGQPKLLEKVDMMIKNPGYCSKYTALNGCQYIVEDGYVKHRQVCH